MWYNGGIENKRKEKNMARYTVENLNDFDNPKEIRDKKLYTGISWVNGAREKFGVWVTHIHFGNGKGTYKVRYGTNYEHYECSVVHFKTVEAILDDVFLSEEQINKCQSEGIIKAKL